MTKKSEWISSTNKRRWAEVRKAHPKVSSNYDTLDEAIAEYFRKKVAERRGLVHANEADAKKHVREAGRRERGGDSVGMAVGRRALP